MHCRRTQTTRSPFPKDERGAALVVALGVLTFLLATSIVFFQMTRSEIRTATNVSNRVRSELLRDGAFATAIAFLNADLRSHPSYTSLDHAWRTYFNGAWAQGKGWLHQPQAFGEDGPLPFLPVVNYYRPWNQPTKLLDQTPGLPDEILGRYFEGNSSRNWLYIPRFNVPIGVQDGIPSLPYPRVSRIPAPFLASSMGDFVTTADSAFVAQRDLNNNGFEELVLSANPELGFRFSPTPPTYPEQVDAWADVDNDEDGFKDSVWIPVATDIFMPRDGLDNDLDGYIDEFDLDGEPGIFIYNGSADGLDNDGDTLIDEADEQYFWTVPDTEIFMVKNIFGNLVPYLGFDWNLAFDPNSPYIDRNVPFAPRPDKIDNDYTLMTDDSIDATPLFLPKPGTPLGDAVGVIPDNPFSFRPGSLMEQLRSGGSVHAEPASEIVARMAILITDESSKVNVAAAGALTYLDDPVAIDGGAPTYNGIAVVRAINQGLSPAEYETRVLPPFDFDIKRARWMKQLLYGAPTGQGGLPESHRLDIDFDRYPGVGLSPTELGRIQEFESQGLLGGYLLDISLPGYGRVDDNGNALWLMANGIDDDGDGTIDEFLEGIDEPGDYRRYRPLRNTLAESDIASNFDGDNDFDGVIDEFGEMGDRIYRTREQLKLVRDIGEGRFNAMKPFVTIHSTDKNDRHFFSKPFTGLLHPYRRAVSGVKLDYNYALAEDIARAFKEDRNYTTLFTIPPAWTDRDTDEDFPRTQDLGIYMDEFQEFARGLRVEGLTYGFSDNPNSPVGIGGAYSNADVTFAEDKELRAMQLAVNIQDNRDRNYGRTELTTRVEDHWWEDLLHLPRGTGPDIEYTVAGVESIRINEIMVRPVRRIEAEMTNLGLPQYRPDPGGFFAERDFDGNFTGVPAFDMEIRTFDDTFWRVGRVEDATGGVIGDGASWFNNVGTTVSDNEVANVSDIIQFTFTPSPGLPPGRYYLTLNTVLHDFAGRSGISVDAIGDLEFAVKYTSNVGGLPLPGTPRLTTTASDPVLGLHVGVTDIIDDEELDQFNAGSGGIPGYESVWNKPIVGFAPNGVDQLKGFDSRKIFLSSADDETRDYTFADPLVGGDIRLAGYRMNEAYTIELPVPISGPPISLVVGIRVPASFEGWGSDNRDNDFDYLDESTDAKETLLVHNVLGLNFFDFSQEPDHEWIELINIDDSGLPINLGGWELQVGASEDPTENRLMRIPEGTLIAPGGMLLLGVNKFDDFQNPPPPFGDPAHFDYDPVNDIFVKQNLIFNNGMGLAAGTVVHSNGFSDTRYVNVTVPGSVGTFGSPFFGIDPISGNPWSVFNLNFNFLVDPDRPLVDFVDTFGDGIPDGTPNDDFVSSTVYPFDVLGQVDPQKGWDRIVELEIPSIYQDEILGAGVVSLSDVAELVLSGGIFPNAPEFDGIDNDGDMRVLSNDQMDNDGNGITDELRFSDNQFDDDGDGIIDNPEEDLLDPGEFGFVPTLRSEGVDEGRFRRETGRYVPGSFGFATVPVMSPFFVNPPTGITERAYFGLPTDPKDWKEFVERRLFPGDNVIITLYEGEAIHNRVVDRVSYSQNDVENRAVDDIVPDDMASALGVGAAPEGKTGTSFWPPNSMAFDFYRSLERRHPLYNGDRFGTQNRWQATDGAYDDWAPSTSRFAYDDQDRDGVVDVIPFDRLDYDVIDRALYEHTFNGSPLRWNLTHRLMENPLTQADVTPRVPPTQFPFPSNPNVVDDRFKFDVAKIRGRNYASSGDLLTVSHFSDFRRLRRDTAQGADELNSNFLGDTSLDSDLESRTAWDISISQVLVGGTNVNNPGIALFLGTTTDLSAVMETAAFDPVVLTVAQADARAYDDTGLDYSSSDTLTWDNGAPVAWTPVHLFDILNDGDFEYGTISGTDFFSAPNYIFGDLFDTDFFPFSNLMWGGLSREDLAVRWGLDERAVMYVSSNRGVNPDLLNEAFDCPDPDDCPPVSTLFEWDGGDGLENGEYDAYIITVENIDFLRLNPYLSFFGEDLLSVMGSHGLLRMEDVPVDIELFSNRDADTFRGPSPLENDRIDDSFGRRSGMVPNDDGVIHYGVIRVTDNYLGLRIWNRGEPGTINRFSRVVLTPRNRTPGRININTAIAQKVPNTGGQNNPQIFHPLVGTSGVLMSYELPDPLGLPFPRPNFDVLTSSFEPSPPNLGQVGGFFDIILKDPLGDAILRNPTLDFYDEAILLRSMLIGANRTFHEDGRYYEFPSDLVRNSGTGFLRKNILITSAFSDPSEDPRTEGERLRDQFDELRERFSRLANQITTRSDVFEIIVTVQAGYGSDANVDGLINYRSNSEFVVTAEQKARMVYER